MNGTQMMWALDVEVCPPSGGFPVLAPTVHKWQQKCIDWALQKYDLNG